jgi:hypothetical protein
MCRVRWSAWRHSRTDGAGWERVSPLVLFRPWTDWMRPTSKSPHLQGQFALLSLNVNLIQKHPVLVSLPFLWQIPEVFSIFREKVYIGSQFWKFHSMTCWPSWFWDCGESAHYVGSKWQSCSLHSQNTKCKQRRLGYHNSLHLKCHKHDKVSTTPQ